MSYINNCQEGKGIAMTIKPELKWKISPAAWLPIGLAIAAEVASNGLRAYGLGAHLDRLTITVADRPVSVAGAVLVLAAAAISLAQARAAWVALTPGPARQRIVAGFAAVLLLSISTLAMASHILEAQRANVADEGGARGRYDRVKAAYDAAAAELSALGDVRTIADVRAAMDAAPVSRRVFTRTSECTDVTRDDSFASCKPILDLRQEMAKAIRKHELEPEAARLAGELAAIDRPEKASASEGAVSGLWGWLMGIGVVFVATFGAVIFARPERSGPANDNAPTVPMATNVLLPHAEAKKRPAPRSTTAASSKRKPVKSAAPADWVAAFRRQHGRTPTIGELQHEFPGTAKTTAWRLCKAA